MCCYRSCLVFNLLSRHDISQGSEPAHLTSGGNFSDDIIANFLLILTVKQIENWLISDKVIRHTKSVPFLGYPVGTDSAGPDDIKLLNRSRPVFYGSF